MIKLLKRLIADEVSEQLSSLQERAKIGIAPEALDLHEQTRHNKVERHTPPLYQGSGHALDRDHRTDVGGELHRETLPVVDTAKVADAAAFLGRAQSGPLHASKVAPSKKREPLNQLANIVDPTDPAALAAAMRRK